MGITDRHIKNAFNEFLRTYPEYAQDAQDIARALYSEIKRQELPFVNDTFEVIASAVQVYENADGDHYAAFQEISGFTEPCGREITREIQKMAPSLGDVAHSPLFAQCQAEHEMTQIRKASRGLTETVKAQLIDFANTGHLEKIALIVREAAIFALLDDECVQLRDIVDELRREGLPAALSPQERYNVLLSSMNDELAGHVGAHARTLAAAHTPAQPPQNPPAKFADFLRQFQP